jgi:hypothetical protein
MCHYLGVDFHKRSVYFALQTPSGQTIQLKRIPAQAEAVKEYLKIFLLLSKQPSKLHETGTGHTTS